MNASFPPFHASVFLLYGRGPAEAGHTHFSEHDMTALVRNIRARDSVPPFTVVCVFVCVGVDNILDDSRLYIYFQWVKWHKRHPNFRVLL